MMTALEKAARAAWAKKFGVPFTAITETQWADVFRDEWMSVIQAAFEAIQPIGAPFAGRAGIAAIIHDIVDSDLDGNLVHVDKASDAILAMLAASPQEAVPTKREAALADLAKLDGETMDLAASPQGEGSSGDPAPIKPSVDTGELRERVARIVDPISWEALDVYGQDKAAFIGLTNDGSLTKAEAILDLIQSERAGSPIGQNDQPDLAFSDAGELREQVTSA